jgi:enoyl-CoA hydratase/carnithine racemase
VREDGGIRPGYKLKLNSYDLGVDIELHDALQRIRFEHPEVHAVVVTSGKERIFCSGANIFHAGPFFARVEGEISASSRTRRATASRTRAAIRD